MKYYVYALRSQKRNYIYVGLTNHLERRISQHNGGHEKTTRPYAPFDLIFTEELGSRLEARKKEKYLKSGIGKDLLKSFPKLCPGGEMADALASGARARKGVEVRVLSRAPTCRRQIGHLAQLVRAPRLHRGCRGFKSLGAHQNGEPR